MIFLEISSQTWIITLVGWVIVFLALVALIIVFSTIPKLLSFNLRSIMKKKGEPREVSTSKKILTGDENAAISMALYLFFNELHDEESRVITIKRTERRYSPWSSKIYGMTNYNFPTR